MKYIEILAFMFIFGVANFLFSGWIKQYSKISEKNYEYKQKALANYFISESFKNTCEGHCFTSLYEWQKVCKDMWNLDYIGWSDARDFLLINNNYEGKILYGTWNSENINGEIFWAEE